MLKHRLVIFGRSLFLLLFCLISLQVVSQRPELRSSFNSAQPNIIFILTDDQRWDAMGAMGNKIILTPNIDRLANAGILFKNAFVTTSICCVSRASILTGQYQSRHGINDFQTDLSANAFSKTYPALLKNAGYHIGFIGKFGVGLNPPANLYDFWVNTESAGKTQPDYIIEDDSGNKIHDTDSIGHAIQKFLDQSTGKQPFCLSVSFKAPHEQDGDPPTYIIQPRYAEYYRETKIPEPVTAGSKYWNTIPYFFQQKENLGRARWMGFLSTPELYQKNVKNYYRLISGVDEVVGEIQLRLQKMGIEKNTIIVFMGDNGMLLGEHGMEGKWNGYDESIRIPLLIYDPRLPESINHLKTNQIALNIDIAPTILSWAGVEVPADMQGVDLIGQVENKHPERKDFFYQHYFLGGPQLPKVEGVVTKNLRYMKYLEFDYEQLFDISHDPFEINNLVNDPVYKKEVNQLRKRYNILKKEVY
jgi:arylsulfatase A-like enzyme